MKRCLIAQGGDYQLPAPIAAIVLFLGCFILRNPQSEYFLGPRGPLVLPSVGPSVRPVRNHLYHLYTGLYILYAL